MAEVRLAVERHDSVPQDARVCDYDELDADAREQFVRLGGESEFDLPPGAAESVRQYDFVKFTDYVSVTVD